MKIYFSASIAGGRKYLSIYKKIVAHLKDNGHDVLSEHIIRDDIFSEEERWAPKNVFEQDIKWLDECEVVIAEVSNPSLGVGYEICYALTKGLKVLCAYESGLFISKMITGNTSERLELFEYRGLEELLEKIDQFLAI
jgi:2'-deoxynucleoside 5'-phosphate N-hydrolase